MMIEIARRIVLSVISGFYVGLMTLLILRISKIKINWKEQMNKLLEASGEQLKSNQKWYEERKTYLSRMGANYLAGRAVLPEEYFLVQILSGVLTGLLCMFLFGIPGIIGGAGGIFLPGLLLGSMNDRDNRRILKEVKGIYDTIQIKTQGGMFLTSAIMECYRNTRNRRLKKALYEMSGQIIAKNNLLETIDEFNMKFQNKYIDNLCIILKQSLDSGKTVEIMQSIQDQLSDMQEAVNLQMRNRLNAKVMWVQVIIFLTLILFCVGASMLSISMDVSL